MPLIRAELRRWRLPRPGPLLHDLSQVLYLPFDHDDGLYARDRSGYDNHGTIYGATREAGKVADALSFDGTDDYVEVPHSAALYLDGDFTVLAWVSLEATPAVWSGAIDKGRPTVNDFWLLCRKDYNQLLWGIGFTDETRLEQVFPTVPLKTWNFYAFGVEASQIFSSFNGGAKTYSPFTKTREIETQDLTLACQNIRAIYAEVRIDEVRIYNKALTEAEIKLIMNMRGL